MHLLTNIAALLLFAPASAPTPAPGPAPIADAPADDATTSPTAAPAPIELPPVEMTGLSDDYVPPFDSDPLELSEVLERSLETNLDLAGNAIDIQITEAQVRAALGAFDVFITAGVNGSISESPQRGSAFAFALGSRSVGANFGVSRNLETGGNVNFTVRATRTLTEQPLNFFDANAGSYQLASYALVPTLTVSHPLLRGAGLRVNRADINRARIAVSQAEAQRQITAQNMVRDIISAYWDLLFAHRDLENKRRSVGLAQRQLERTQALVAAGRQSPVDAKAVEQALAARESDVINAENGLLVASLNLRTLMGESLADQSTLGVLPMTDPVVQPRPVDIKSELDNALANNAQIRQLQLGIESRRIDELVAANNRLPQLDVSGSFTPQGRSVDSVPDTTTGEPGTQGSWPEAFRNIFSSDIRDGVLADWTLSGQINLTWDVQNRGPKGQHEAARLQIKKAELQLDQARQQVAAGTIQSANSLRTAAKVMEVAEISLELAKDNLEAEQARFDVGRSTNYDVLQRLDQVDQAAAQALSAQISYLKALVQLQALNGEILPAYGIDLQ
ncbi:TolC family protein [Paraliomyxa miuraensis]|uniref:TolC family protein n=1 Tax=Paraliomyxa miuraensis TaxID=376150 RepID=UPI0022572333|nr:TolC family protein [Paraliomyxa miuraensis]MCX4245051.1 TolC family protein [Paraliomyxa miuraensis]